MEKSKLPGNKLIHISIGKTDFKCPYCDKQYDDINDKYLNRIQKQMDKKKPKGYINIKCGCKQSFGLSFNYMGHLVSFKT